MYEHGSQSKELRIIHVTKYKDTYLDLEQPRKVRHSPPNVSTQVVVLK